MARGRPRLKGNRYPGGKLKPPEPNARVLELRRSLLAANDPDAKVDISKAENALDLMLARGWISEGQHRAARRYAALWIRHSRRVLGAAPGMKVSSATSSYSPSLAHAQGEDEGPLSSGVRTPADFAYAKAVEDYDAGRIDIRALNKAEKAHRSARIDWSKLPDSAVAEIFWHALGIDDASSVAKSTEAEEWAEQDRATIRRIWARLSADECQELYTTCVLESWPQWVVWRAAGKVVPPGWDRKRTMLLKALDVVIDETRSRRPEPEQPQTPIELAEKSIGPKLIERTAYIDAEGNLLYEVERRVRR